MAGHGRRRSSRSGRDVLDAGFRTGTEAAGHQVAGRDPHRDLRPRGEGKPLRLRLRPIGEHGGAGWSAAGRGEAGVDPEHRRTRRRAAVLRHLLQRPSPRLLPGREPGTARLRHRGESARGPEVCRGGAGRRRHAARGSPRCGLPARPGRGLPPHRCRREGRSHRRRTRTAFPARQREPLHGRAVRR